MTREDDNIRTDVMEEIAWDPKVTAVSDQSVSVMNGWVTVAGAVNNGGTRDAAADAVYRVRGVRGLTNEMTIKRDALGLTDDEEIAVAVRNSIQYDWSLPRDRVSVSVQNGNVTLSGTTDHYYQKLMAGGDALRTSGVLDVINDIALVVNPTKADVKSNIQKALVRHAQIDANKVTVVLDGGHVTLSGTVRSWPERTEAGDAAWRASGVTEVKNNLKVEAYA